jgi:hypothetical protein
LQPEILCGHVGKDKNGAQSSRPYPHHYFGRIKYWSVKVGLSACWLESKKMVIISEDVLYQRSNYRKILQGDSHCVIEEGNKILLEIHLTIMEYIEYKGEFWIVNKYLKNIV